MTGPISGNENITPQLGRRKNNHLLAADSPEMESDVYTPTAALGFHFVFVFKKIIIRESLVLSSWRRRRRRGLDSEEDVNCWCQCVSGGLH